MRRVKKNLRNDNKKVEKMAEYGLTNREIADVLGMSDTHLVRLYVDNLRKGRAINKMRLRRKQFQVAMKGNITMLIWLGKVYLGQRESVSAIGGGEGERGEAEISTQRNVVGGEGMKN